MNCSSVSQFDKAISRDNVANAVTMSTNNAANQRKGSRDHQEDDQRNCQLIVFVVFVLGLNIR